MEKIDLTKMKPNLITIRDFLCGDYYFRIPDYQRGFAWTDEKEFKDLWYDIKRLYTLNNKNLKHYTGMIALEKVEDEEILKNEFLAGKVMYYVVDGQQRLTSIVIIIQALLNYIKEDDNDTYNKNIDILRKEANDYKLEYTRTSSLQEDREYFSKRIYNMTNCSQKCSNAYQININNACEYIQNKLKSFSYIEAKQILQKILDNMFFNVYFVTQGFDVRLTFETMNNRGKKLSNLELLKNRLLYLTSLFDFDDINKKNKLRFKIDNSWKKIYTNLCVNDLILSDDNYLKAHWFIYKTVDKRNGSRYIDDLLNKEFSLDDGDFYKLFFEDVKSNIINRQELDECYNKIDQYIDSLEEYSSYWAIINAPYKVKIDSNIDEDEFVEIKRLYRLTDNFYVRTSILPILHDQSDYTYKQEYYKVLEKTIFINKYIAFKKDNDFSALITNAKNVLKDLSKTERYNQMINNLKNNSTLSILNKNINDTVNEFFNNIFDKDNLFYSWNGLKYFLYEYNESLSGDNAKNVNWCDINKSSIEHVLPETPNREYWQICLENYNDDEKFKIIHALGNLVLLSSGSENSTLSNLSFSTKKNIDVDQGKFAYCYGSRAAIEISKNKVWRYIEIIDRTQKLFKFMYTNWFSDLKDGDGNQIISLNNWVNLIDKNLKSKFPQNKDDDQKLKEKLYKIDTSDEVKILETDIKEKIKGKDYRFGEFIKYFDLDLFGIHYNKKNLTYIDENCYTVKFIPIEPYNKLDEIKCSTKMNIDNNLVKINIEYSRQTDKIIVSKQYGETIVDNKLSENVRAFKNSLSRYIERYVKKELK